MPHPKRARHAGEVGYPQQGIMRKLVSVTEEDV